MNNKAPEQMGISSANIKAYIDMLEQYELSTHGIIMARGNHIFYEQYWEPFTSGYAHRMYSVTKSIVSLAIGFAEQDGLLNLDDKIVQYFEGEVQQSTRVDENVRKQTIRHMLMMSTAKSTGGWFSTGTDDRVRLYFENENASREPGIRFEYDSCGSFVLGALVERLTHMSLMDYLRIKLFDIIGVSKEAHFLKCLGGHSWGDSALICTSRDLLLIARFVMNEGRWNGEQILNKEYLALATSKQMETQEGELVDYNSHGYGYQIWRTYDNSYMFYGMGCQFAVCVPDKDIIFIYNGDNQGQEGAEDFVVRNFFETIVRTTADIPLDRDLDMEELLNQPRKLMCAQGANYAKIQEKLQDVVFKLQPNPMRITECSLRFSGDGGCLYYTNAQGKKELSFGMKRNVFGYFPEEGYSDQIGGERATGHYYRCAASAAWQDELTLHIKVQVIDEYFGRLDIVLHFDEGNQVDICMTKTAENFLDEYVGTATGEWRNG